MAWAASIIRLRDLKHIFESMQDSPISLQGEFSE